ncbi:hypothetical protein ACHAXT_011064 [Thalassiosira profunda]
MAGAATEISAGKAAGKQARTCTVPGHFDASEIEDAQNPYPHPVHLVPLPLLPSQRPSASSASSDKAGNGAGEKADVLAFSHNDTKIYLVHRNEPIPIRTYEEKVRALAASPDGLRVAVGFEDGTTKIYSFDDYSPDENEGSNDGVHHPFIPSGALTKKDGDDFLSQADLSQADEGIAEYDGPRADMTVRHLAFDPRSAAGGAYFLAVASESGDKPLVIVDAATEESATTVHLEDKGGDEYDGSGVRSVAYTAASNSSGDGESTVLLATLGMDGKVVTWDVTSTNEATLEFDWDACHKDFAPAVPRRDLGDMGGDAADKACQLAWGTADGGDGVLFAAGQNEVQCKRCPLSKGAKECQAKLKGAPAFVVAEGGNGHTDGIVALAVPPTTASKNGKHRLITGGRDGRLLLWDLALDEAAGSAAEIELERRADTVGVPPVTSVVWCAEGEASVAFADGTVASVPVDVAAARAKDQAAKTATRQEADEAAATDEAPIDEGATAPLKQAAIDDDGEDSDATVDLDGTAAKDTEDDAASVANGEAEAAAPAKGATQSAAAQSKARKSKFIDDEASDGDDDVRYDDVAPQKAIEEEEETAEKDADAAKDKEETADDALFEAHDDPLELDDAPPAHSARSSAPRAPPLQPAFAPSATPLGDPRRILCWNHVGVVTLRSAAESGAGENNLVDISFHESAAATGGRRPVTFTDNAGFIVGTLGEDGGLFASDLQEDPDSDDDEDYALGGRMAGVIAAAKRREKRYNKKKGGGARGSEVYFRRFATFGRAADKDWVVALPDGERALGVATGKGWGAVITSRRYLRLFTAGGVQGPVIWIPGAPVTVVGRERYVAVVHHRSNPLPDGTQLLGYTLLDGLTGATLASGELSAVSPGSSLAWAGFSDRGVLSAMDADGVLSMLNRHPGLPGGNWMPVLDTVGWRKSASDVFWPVEVYGGKLACVPLRGGREHPDAVRRPLTTTLSLRIPMATGLTAKSGSQEELSVRAAFALNQAKVHDDYLVSQGDADADETEELYEQRCVSVDKETLKLFNATVAAGKVERAYDLVARLRSEKAMDLALKVADRVGQHKLSDKIEELLARKYPPLDEDGEGFDDAASYDSRRSDGSDDDAPAGATRRQRMERPSQRISPEGGRTPRAHGEECSTDEESPPREALKRKFEAAPAAAKKRTNPFAKKRLESPAKSATKGLGSPARLSLSRSSTFSASARKKQRRGKQIL